MVGPVPGNGPANRAFLALFCVLASINAYTGLIARFPLLLSCPPFMPFRHNLIHVGYGVLLHDYSCECGAIGVIAAVCSAILQVRSVLYGFMVALVGFPAFFVEDFQVRVSFPNPLWFKKNFFLDFT